VERQPDDAVYFHAWWSRERATKLGRDFRILPRVSATAKANLVFVRLPDILAESAGSTAQALNDATGIPVPALSGTASIGVYPGISLAPTVGGVGAVDLLGSASWLPLSTFDVEGFDEDTPGFSYGVGARLGLLRESFTMPGVSVSLMYHKLGTVTYGNVCEDPGLGGVTARGDGYVATAGPCLGGGGDPGEFSLDLSSWSSRAAVSKRLLGLGLTAGVGYDRVDSDMGFGLRSRCPLVGGDCYFRASGLEVDNGRWSGFVNGSFTLLFASMGAEVGWLQGEPAIEGFPTASDFDPEKGTFFGIKYSVPAMRDSGGGSIINMASVAALVGVPDRAAYCAAKGGILALTRAAAIDHVSEGIRVNCIAPGTVDTPWIDRITAGYDDPAEARARMEARQPHGRFVTPEEIAAMAAYLASDESASAIGACMVVDGGMSAR